MKSWWSRLLTTKHRWFFGAHQGHKCRIELLPRLSLRHERREEENEWWTDNWMLKVEWIVWSAWAHLWFDHQDELWPEEKEPGTVKEDASDWGKSPKLPDGKE